jgi:hypothetical protein
MSKAKNFKTAHGFLEAYYSFHCFGKIAIGSASYQSKYISWLQSLPKLELGPPRKKSPLSFRFDGGEGLLMPVGPGAPDNH